MDTIVGCFAVGLEPSGSADPFGLRRAAIGIWQILLAPSGLGRRCGPPLFAAARDALAEQGVTVKDPTRARGVLPRPAARHLRRPGHPGRRTPTRRSRRTSAIRSTRAPARSRARRSRRRRARCSSASRTSSTTRAARSSRSAATPDPTQVRRADNVEHSCTPRSATRRQRERAPRATRDYAAVFESLERLRPDGRRVLRQGRRDGHGSRSDAARQPARAPRLVPRARTWRSPTSGCSQEARREARPAVRRRHRRGPRQGQGAARRQGREPRRDGVARPAGAARASRSRPRSAAT